MAILGTIGKFEPPHREDTISVIAAVILTFGLHLILAQLLMFKSDAPQIDISNPISVKLIPLLPPSRSYTSDLTSELDVPPLLSLPVKSDIRPVISEYTPSFEQQVVLNDVVEISSSQVPIIPPPILAPSISTEISEHREAQEAQEVVIHVSNYELLTEGWTEKNCIWKIALQTQSNGIVDAGDLLSSGPKAIKDCPNYRSAAKGDRDRRNKPIAENRWNNR